MPRQGQAQTVEHTRMGLPQLRRTPRQGRERRGQHYARRRTGGESKRLWRGRKSEAGNAGRNVDPDETGTLRNDSPPLRGTS